MSQKLEFSELEQKDKKCGRYQKWKRKKVGIFRTRIERQKIQSLSEVEEKKIGIYIVYMGFYRAIYNNIAASTSDFFFRPRPAARTKKKSSVSGLYTGI